MILKSGCTLEITAAPFAQSKALYAAVAEELKELQLDPKAEIDVNFMKGIFCTAISSKKIEAALHECLKRCLYNNAKIGSDTFEPIEAREDYLEICFEVTKENIAPFMKNLYAQYSDILKKLMEGIRA